MSSLRREGVSQYGRSVFVSASCIRAVIKTTAQVAGIGVRVALRFKPMPR